MTQVRSQLVIEGRSDLQGVSDSVERLNDTISRLEDALTDAARAGQRFEPPEFDQAAEEAERAERSIGGLSGGLTRLHAIAIAANAAVAGLAIGFVALLESSAEYQRDLRGLAFITGRSIDELEGFTRAVVVLGGEMDDARDAILDFNERIGEARADPASEIGESFRRVNFDVSQADVTLEDYLQTLNAVPDRRVALFEARTILGDTGARLLPLLVEGDLEGTIEANMALVLDDEARRELEESSRAYRQASAEFGAAIDRLLSAGLPALTAILNDFFVGEGIVAGGLQSDLGPLLDFFRSSPAFQEQGPFQDQGPAAPAAFSTAQFGGGAFPSTSIGAFARGSRDFFARDAGPVRPTSGLTAEELDVELGDHVQIVIDLLDDFGTGLSEIDSDISDLDLSQLQQATASFSLALEQAAPTLSLLREQGLAAGAGTLAGGLVGGVGEQAAQRIVAQVAEPVFNVVEGALTIVGDIFSRAADEQEAAAEALQAAAQSIAQQTTGGLGGVPATLFQPLINEFLTAVDRNNPAASIQNFLQDFGDFPELTIRGIARLLDTRARDEDARGPADALRNLGVTDELIETLVAFGEGDAVFGAVLSQAIRLSGAFDSLTSTVQGLDDAERRRIAAEFDLQEIAIRQSAQSAFAQAGSSPAAQQAAFRSLTQQLAGLEDAERAALAAAQGREATEREGAFSDQQAQSIIMALDEGFETLGMGIEEQTDLLIEALGELNLGESIADLFADFTLEDFQALFDSFTLEDFRNIFATFSLEDFQSLITNFSLDDFQRIFDDFTLPDFQALVETFSLEQFQAVFDSFTLADFQAVLTDFSLDDFRGLFDNFTLADFQAIIDNFTLAGFSENFEDFTLADFQALVNDFTLADFEAVFSTFTLADFQAVFGTFTLADFQNLFAEFTLQDFQRVFRNFTLAEFQTVFANFSLEDFRELFEDFTLEDFRQLFEDFTLEDFRELFDTFSLADFEAVFGDFSLSEFEEIFGNFTLEDFQTVFGDFTLDEFAQLFADFTLEDFETVFGDFTLEDFETVFGDFTLEDFQTVFGDFTLAEFEAVFGDFTLAEFAAIFSNFTLDELANSVGLVSEELRRRFIELSQLATLGANLADSLTLANRRIEIEQERTLGATGGASGTIMQETNRQIEEMQMRTLGVTVMPEVPTVPMTVDGNDLVTVTPVIVPVIPTPQASPGNTPTESGPGQGNPPVDINELFDRFSPGGSGGF